MKKQVNLYSNSKLDLKMQHQVKRPSHSSLSELPAQLVKQFNKGALKKSDLLLLQRYCEQNGINYSQLIENTLARQKQNQSVIVYDPPRESHFPGQAPSSLKHGKTKSVGILNPSGNSNSSLAVYPKQTSGQQSTVPTSETQRNSSARGVKFNLEHQPNYMVGSNSNQSLHHLGPPYDKYEGSKFKSNNINNISVVQPQQQFSASNGYLTQVHSPSKRLKSGHGKSTPEMQAVNVSNVGMKQSISSKHPQKKEQSVYTNSHANSSILSNSQHMGDTTLIQNTSLVDDHQTPFEYQFQPRPSSLDKKVQVQQNPAFQQQLRKQIEINNYLRGNLVVDSPPKNELQHVAQAKALLPGVKGKEEPLRPYHKALSEFKRSDVPSASGQKATIYSNNLIGGSQPTGNKQTRSGSQAQQHKSNLHSQGSQSSVNARSARGQDVLNVSQDLKVPQDKGKSSLLMAQSQKKMKNESLHSHKVSQKFVLNPTSQPKQAQIQNIILNQSKRQKAKTNANSLQSSFVNLGTAPRKSDAGVAKHPQKELLHYIDNFQKATITQSQKGYEQQRKPAVRTTQSSPRSLNLSGQTGINRNYYKQQISAPNSDKYQLSSSNLLNASYSELHNLPNDVRSSKRSLQVESQPQNQPLSLKQTISTQRKLQQQQKVSQPYTAMQRKDYFSVAQGQHASQSTVQTSATGSGRVSGTVSGSQTPSRLIDNHLVYQYQDLSTIQVEHSDQVIRDKRLSLNADRKHAEKSPSLNDQYLALIQRNQSRLSSNEDSSTDQQNRRHLNPIMDGGTGTSNNLLKGDDTDSNRRESKGQPAKQSKTPSLKKEQMVYMLQKQPKATGKKEAQPSLQVTKKDSKDFASSQIQQQQKYHVHQITTGDKPKTIQYRLPTESHNSNQSHQTQKDKIAAKPYQHDQSVEVLDQRHSLAMLFENIEQGALDKRSNSQPNVDVQLRLKPNIIEPGKKGAQELKVSQGFDSNQVNHYSKGVKSNHHNSSKYGALDKSIKDRAPSAKQEKLEDKISNSQYVASGHHAPGSGTSTAKSQSKNLFKRQGSQPSIKKQPSQSSLHSRPASALGKEVLREGALREGSQKQKPERREEMGPRTKHSRADKPLKEKEPFITSLENFAREMEEECQRLVTEEDENQIREVASDINERAFYGKIMRTMKALTQGTKALSQLSPRSQEIGSVMQLVAESFKKNGAPPVTQITFYRIGKMLGRGAFGKVNLAMHKLVRKLVALKSLNKQILTDEAHKAKLMKEVNLLLKLRHNHVVKIYETIETEKHIIIVMELCAGGDLLNYVRKRRRLKEPYAQKIFKQIIDGLCYIHAKQIAHRDIKLDNILLDGKGNVKIGDFGVSRQIQEGQIMREQCGTPAYIAPEILRNKGYSLNVDLWSAGVVLFAMLYGTVPFKAQSMEELHQLILKGKYLLKEDISQEARDMLRGLLEINPKKRLTIKQIYQHPWLKSMDKTIQLFTDEEREMIKKEYTYNDPSRYNRNENEEPVDCFTEHGFESEYSSFKNNTSKSVILAPFNSTMSDNEESFISQNNVIQSLMYDKPAVLRFAKKCREIDRQYEFNNNGKLDNGVYHKQIANNSFEGDQNMSGTQGIEIVQYLSETPSIQYNVKTGNNKRNDKSGLSATGEEQQTFETFQREAHQRGLDPAKIDKLVAFGYPESYVRKEIETMQPNYCTAGYYLLEMDQNYC